jgi:hypothetical protein
MATLSRPRLAAGLDRLSSIDDNGRNLPAEVAIPENAPVLAEPCPRTNRMTGARRLARHARIRRTRGATVCLMETGESRR